MAFVFLDFETRSRIDLRKSQAAKYAADPSTVPLMLAYGSDNDFRQWRLPPDYDPAGPPPACPTDLRAFAEDPGVEFHAHNAAFEIAIWEGVCVQRWGWPSVPLCRWHCTAAQAALANQPRSLEGVGARLRLPSSLQKSPEGKALISGLSVPIRAQVSKTRDGRVNTLSLAYQQSLGTPMFEGQWGGKTALYFFDNDPKLLDAFAKYNLQDIVAEQAVHRRLPPMPEAEHRVWVLDQEINQRGIPIDVDLCQGAVDIQRLAAKNCNEEILMLTGFDVEAGTQRQRLVTWLNQRVDFGEKLTEDAVSEWVESFTDPNTWGCGVVHPGHDPHEVMPLVLNVLDLRAMTAGTAVAKFQAALDAISDDGRIRGQLLYCGATTTGRWAGRGIQPHNMKRSKTPGEDVLDVIKQRDWLAIQAMAKKMGRSPLAIIKDCIRGMVLAPPGRKLIVSDFAGIESRVLNWLADNTGKLELFQSGQDTYIRAALDVYGGAEADIADWDGKKWKIKKEHAEKRQVGKVCELALGYGMGAGKFVDTARKMAGVVLTPEFAEKVVKTWRDKNERIRNLWYRLEKAFIHQVKNMRNPNRRPVDIEGKLRVGCWPGGYVTITLPSGRRLYYFQPKLDGDGRILYLDGSKHGKSEKDGRIDTYGGKLTENVVQAISRDLLVNSMTMIDNVGLDLILHVHDEAVVEADEDDTNAATLVHNAMQTLPPWAGGLPLAAETQTMRRYSK